MRKNSTQSLTLRMNSVLAKRFDEFCHSEGYSKNGLLLKLIQNFLNQRHLEKIKPSSTLKNLKRYAASINLGGDALAETKEYGL